MSILPSRSDQLGLQEVIIGEPTFTDLHKELADKQSIVPAVLLDLALNAIECSRLSNSIFHGVDIEATNRVFETLRCL